jgi:hypothetical protein
MQTSSWGSVQSSKSFVMGQSKVAAHFNKEKEFFLGDIPQLFNRTN